MECFARTPSISSAVWWSPGKLLQPLGQSIRSLPVTIPASDPAFDADFPPFRNRGKLAEPPGATEARSPVPSRDVAGGGCMSQTGVTAEHGVSWPSNGISEVPFRVYTDQDQYHREQERLFKGPTWNYLCLTVELTKPGD